MAVVERRGINLANGRIGHVMQNILYHQSGSCIILDKTRDIRSYNLKFLFDFGMFFVNGVVPVISLKRECNASIEIDKLLES